MSSKSPCADNIDEKKLKRKASNRESARKSRLRKQQRVEELLTQDSQMAEENKKLRLKIEDITQKYMSVASDNNVLRAREAELTDRLKSLNSVLQIASDRIGLAAFDGLEIPNTLLEPWQMDTLMEPLQQETLMMEPWQLPYSMQSIPANADMFQY